MVPFSAIIVIVFVIIEIDWCIWDEICEQRGEENWRKPKWTEV